MGIQTVLALLTVLALMGICFRGLRFLKLRSAERNPPRMRILETSPLGDKRQLLLVEVDDKLLVVGSTPNRISPLLRLHDPAVSLASRPESPVCETGSSVLPAQLREVGKSGG